MNSATCNAVRAHRSAERLEQSLLATQDVHDETHAMTAAHDATYTATKPAAEAARPTTFNVSGPGSCVQNIAVIEAPAKVSSHINRPNLRPARESMSGMFRRRVGISAAAIIACRNERERERHTRARARTSQERQTNNQAYINIERAPGAGTWRSQSCSTDRQTMNSHRESNHIGRILTRTTINKFPPFANEARL